MRLGEHSPESGAKFAKRSWRSRRRRRRCDSRAFLCFGLSLPPPVGSGNLLSLVWTSKKPQKKSAAGSPTDLLPDAAAVRMRLAGIFNVGRGRNRREPHFVDNHLLFPPTCCTNALDWIIWLTSVIATFNGLLQRTRQLRSAGLGACDSNGGAAAEGGWRPSCVCSSSLNNLYW